MLAGGLAAVAVVFSAIALTRTPKTVLVGRALTAARYERALGRDAQVPAASTLERCMQAHQQRKASFDTCAARRAARSSWRAAGRATCRS